MSYHSALLKKINTELIYVKLLVPGTQQVLKNVCH